MSRSILLVQLATTLPLVGLIWTIQLVHYPLFARVGAAGFSTYHAAHSQRISWLVVPLMFAELFAAIAWVASPPARGPAWLATAMLGLVGAAWITTAFASVPAHARLGAGFDAAALDALVTTNWARTAAWTVRAAVLLWLTAGELERR